MAEKTLLLKRRESVHVQNLPDGSALLFDTATATAYPVTESAAHIWELCDGAHTVQEMVEELESRYEIDRETIERDTLDLIDDLREKELLDELSAGDSE